jgi:hypothetical protein
MPPIVAGEITVVQKRGKWRFARLLQRRIHRGILLLGVLLGWIAGPRFLEEDWERSELVNPATCRTAKTLRDLEPPFAYRAGQFFEESGRKESAA